MNNISICINTSKLELKYIQLLLKSIEMNMFNKENEILIFIDTDTEDNLIENSLKLYKNVFKNLSLYKNTLPSRIGYQHNVNLMFRLAKNDVVLFIQSDMVVGPRFDKNMFEKLKDFNVVCGTRIEPNLHGTSSHTITKNFGFTPDEFQLNSFNDFCEQVSDPLRITSYFFAPFMMNKVVWLGIGGHDTRFRRSREDSDILTRFVLDGIKIIQCWHGLFYHFTCTSSRGQGWYDQTNKEAQTKASKQQFADRIEVYKFIHKWGTIIHDTEKKVVHYKIDCFVDIGANTPPNTLYPLIPLFDKVYLNNESLVSSMREKLEKDTVQLANELDGFSESDWQSKKHLYNSENWEGRILYSPNVESVKSNSLVVINPSDLWKISTPNFVEDLCNLHNTLKSGLSNGRYAADSFELIVNDPVEDSSDKIIVKNPEYNDFKRIDTTN